MADIRKGFKKYEYEDIRTEYKNISTAVSATIPAGTIVKLTDASGVTSIAKAVSGTDTPSNSNMNSTLYLLAEDAVKDDKGFVYYIVEDVNNLEDRV